jgi:hypothetical protein
LKGCRIAVEILFGGTTKRLQRKAGNTVGIALAANSPNKLILKFGWSRLRQAQSEK